MPLYSRLCPVLLEEQLTLGSDALSWKFLHFGELTTPCVRVCVCVGIAPENVSVCVGL